jgi:hypothetical protein
LDSSEQPHGSEAAACSLICERGASEDAVPVVQAEVITLHLTAEHVSVGHRSGVYSAIVIPQYCGSVATQLQLSEAAVATGGARMVRALEHIHSKGLVHIDVKVCSAE